MKKSLLAIAALVCGLAFTSCETEEGEMSDVLDFTNLKAKAIAAEGGSIELSGSIKANTKIQAFGLYQLNDKDKLKPAIDLLDKMSQLKELGEDGKEFTVDIVPTQIKVADAANYTLYAKTKKEKARSCDLGKAYTDLPVGLGATSQLGSYVSFSKGEVYKMTDLVNGNKEDGYTVKDAEKLASVEAIINAEGQLVAASKAINPVIATNCGKSFIEGGVVITESKTIATYSLSEADANGDAKISGVAINSDNITIDVEGYEFE